MQIKEIPDEKRPPRGMMKGLPKWTQTLFKRDKTMKIVLILGIAGIALIFLSTYLTPKKKSTETAAIAVSTKAYTEELEQKLTTILGGIDGVGQTEIMVTLENGVEYVYANEEKINTNTTEDYGSNDKKKVQEKEDYEQKLILVEGTNGKEALIQKQLEPKVQGVVVVCEGGESAVVQQRVISAVTTALNINANRVCVTKLS